MNLRIEHMHKNMHFCSLLKAWVHMQQNVLKNYVINLVKNLLIVLKNVQQMQYNLLHKDQFKKQQKQLVIYLVIK